MSRCAKCNGTLFRLQEQSPSGSSFSMQFIQCSSCGAPIGAMEYLNSGAVLQGVEAKINRIESKLDQIEYEISSLNRKIA